MTYNTQNDSRWKDHVMNSPPFENGYRQLYPDTIGVSDEIPETFRFQCAVGCYVSSLANELQIIFGIEKTPGQVNEDLIKNNGYQILALGSCCPKGQESYIVEQVAEKIYSIQIETVLPQQYRNRIGERYIAVYRSMGVNHYVNVLNDVIINDKPFLEIFNVWNGNVEQVSFDKVISLRKITKR